MKDNVSKIWNKIPCVIRAMLIVELLTIGIWLVFNCVLVILYKLDFFQNYPGTGSYVESLVDAITIIPIYMYYRHKFKAHQEKKDYSKYIKAIFIDSMVFWIFWAISLYAIVDMVHEYTIEWENVLSLQYVIYFIIVGFREEILFRYIFYEYIRNEKNRISARDIIIGATSFGIIHVVNLVNGRSFVSVAVQVVFAIGIGAFWSVIYCYRGQSLIFVSILHMLSNMNNLSKSMLWDCLQIQNVHHTRWDNMWVLENVNYYVASVVITIIIIRLERKKEHNFVIDTKLES